MEGKNLDDLIKSRIENAEVPPPPMVWEGVQRELQRRRRPAAGYWATGVLVLAVAAFGLFSVFQNEKNALSAADFQPENDASLPANPTDLNLKNLEKTADATAKSNEKNSAVENLTTDETSQPSKFLNKKSGRLPKVEAKQLTLPNQQNEAQSAENQNFEADAAPITADFSEPERLDWRKNQVESQAKKLSAVELLRSEIEPLESERPLPIIPKFQSKRTKCYGFQNSIYKALLLDAYVSPVFAEQKLEAKTANFQNYRDRRAAAEKYSVAEAIGVRASLVRGPLVLRGGLEYTQFTEVFDHVVANFSKTTTVTDIIYVNGEPQPRTRTVQEFGELREKIYNRFGTLDLPVNLGAEARLGKFGMSLNGGVAANLLFWKKGRVLDPKVSTTDQVSGHTDMAQFFKNNAGLSANASLQAFLKMKNGNRIFVEPYFQKTLKPVSLPTAPLDQRYNFYGCRIGLTKVFD